MSTIIIKHENNSMHIIENVSYEDTDKVRSLLLDEARYKEKYDINVGDICRYKDVATNNIFLVTKIMYQEEDDSVVGFFNAIYSDGDVIANGTLDLIERIPNEDNHMVLDLENFLYKIKKREEIKYDNSK